MEPADRQLLSGIVPYSPVIVSTESFKSALSGVVLIPILLFIEESLWWGLFMEGLYFLAIPAREY